MAIKIVCLFKISSFLLFKIKRIACGEFVNYVTSSCADYSV